MTFEDVFGADRANLERVISENPYERQHIQRCDRLADAIAWDQGEQEGEFVDMLGPDGIHLFDRTLRQIQNRMEALGSPELSDPKRLMKRLAYVHDLGKYDRAGDTYNGKDHEQRSAEIVWSKRDILVNQLGWEIKSVQLLRDLARTHGLLGMIRIGDASIWFLSPVLEAIQHFEIERKRLFLDLLVILTCCDSGASGDFQAHRFYLDDFRIKFYRQVADEAFDAAGQADWEEALLQKAAEFSHTVGRIQRLVSAGRAELWVTEKTINSVLQRAIDQGYVELRSLATKRFDHGFYVFEPLLVELAGGKRELPANMLYHVLIFLGTLSGFKAHRSVISLRDSFSVREDLREKNGKNFYDLVRAVKGGSEPDIRRVLERHAASF